MALKASLPIFLLQSPKHWTFEDLQTVQVERCHVSIRELRIGNFLPRDGNEEFEELAAELTRLTKEDLLDLANQRSTYRKNIFHPFFLRLYDVTKPNSTFRSCKSAMSELLNILLSNASAVQKLLRQSTLSAMNYSLYCAGT